MIGDVFVTISLADSNFFSATTGAARPRVLLYLLITMAPFAVVAPVLGPLLDRTRGGRRLLMAGACVGRAITCILMANVITDHNNLTLYPLAFCLLVLSKGQGIAKSSLVPAVIDRKDELVRANSRLALISVLGSALAGPIAAAVLKIPFLGAPWVLRLAAAIFLLAAMLALAIPRASNVGPMETIADREVLHARSIIVAGSAMGLVRGVVGFTTFFAAFVLKKQHEPAWVFGLVLAGSAIGNAIGTLVAPVLRRRVREEWILAGSLVIPAVALLFAARTYGRVSLIFAAGAIAASAASARLGFDSLLQRDGAEAVRGRAFARFETRFQLAWVVGGVLAVLFWGGGRSGIFLVAVVLLFAGLSYVGTVRRMSAPPRNTPALPPPAE
jgi:MFS family permease